MVGWDWVFGCGSRRSERRLVVAADAGGGPRVVGTGRGSGCATLRRGRRGSRGRPRVVAGGARGRLTAAAVAVRRTARPLGTRDLGRGVLQRRTDLVDLDLED